MFIWIFIAASELTAESKPATQYTIDANQEVYAKYINDQTLLYINEGYTETLFQVRESYRKLHLQVLHVRLHSDVRGQ